MAAQPTQRRPMTDSSCAALSEGCGAIGGVITGDGGGAGWGSGSGATLGSGGGVTGGGGCGLASATGGDTRPPASDASIRCSRASSREVLFLASSEITKATMGRMIAVRTTTININKMKNSSISREQYHRLNWAPLR